MTHLLPLLLVLLQPPPHPCDVVSPSPIAIAGVGPQKLGFCWDERDTGGGPVTVTRFRILDGTAEVWSGMLLALGPANTAGYRYYETPPINFSPGPHALRAIADRLEVEGIPSLPFSFTFLPPQPSAPVGLRIAK